MLVYFLQGTLPWQGLKSKDPDQKNELILEKKKTIDTGNLCQGLPQEFKIYFDHIRSLDIGKAPDYSYLRKLFDKLFIRKGFDHDHVFDWTVLKYLMSTS